MLSLLTETHWRAFSYGITLYLAAFSFTDTVPLPFSRSLVGLRFLRDTCHVSDSLDHDATHQPPSTFRLSFASIRSHHASRRACYTTPTPRTAQPAPTRALWPWRVLPQHAGLADGAAPARPPCTMTAQRHGHGMGVGHGAAGSPDFQLP